ncbi:hypothetical protein N9026_00775 [bacterium]|nr:hypothetical protein [bacterium]
MFVVSTLGQILIQIGQIKPRRCSCNNCILKTEAYAAARRSATLPT